MATSHYDQHASLYAADVEDNVFNALYERPSTLMLVGDVRGQRVLDAGCGSGAHARELLARGASVVGFDQSAGLLAEAHARLGGMVPLYQADLSEPLTFAEDGAFDVVVAALVLHYLRDWLPPMREFARVLRPGGRLVFSTHHPFLDFVLSNTANYYRIEEWDDVWHKSGTMRQMRYWRRPLEAILAPVREAGFVVERVSEGQVDPRAQAKDTRAYQLITTRPQFLFVRGLPNVTRSRGRGQARSRLTVAMERTRLERGGGRYAFGLDPNAPLETFTPGAPDGPGRYATCSHRRVDG